MKLKYFIFPIFLLGCNQSFADFQKIMTTYNVVPKKSQQEFDIALNKLETANFNARLDLQKAYYAYKRDPHGYNNVACIAMEYAEALKKMLDYNPLYTSQNTRNDMANSLFSTYAFTQNARCPQRVAPTLPKRNILGDDLKRNLPQETFKFLADYEHRQKDIKPVLSNPQFLELVCETKEHLTIVNNFYLKNIKTSGVQEYYVYQIFEKNRLEAIDILKRNNLESSCINGKLTLPVSTQPAYNYSGNNQISSYSYQLENKVPETSKPKISTEQKTCAIVNILLRSADKNLGTTKCN